jgi:hypothetical protein
MECRRSGEVPPSEMTFNAADVRRKPFAREHADLMIARWAAAGGADLEGERMEPRGDKLADTH